MFAFTEGVCAGADAFFVCADEQGRQTNIPKKRREPPAQQIISFFFARFPLDLDTSSLPQEFLKPI
jgi:hypothetical protein